MEAGTFTVFMVMLICGGEFHIDKQKFPTYPLCEAHRENLVVDAEGLKRDLACEPRLICIQSEKLIDEGNEENAIYYKASYPHK